LDESKQNYDPKTTLVQNSFTDIQENIIYSTEYFSPEAAMAHAKTMRMWEKIPELDQPEIEHKLREFISAHLDENMQYPRQLATVIVSGIKPL
jgi:hypothetical protein